MNRNRLALTALFSLAVVISPALAQDPTSAEDKKKQESPEALDKKAVKLAHGLRMAEMRLQVARLDARISLDGVASSKRKAARELALAKQTLAHFDKFIAPSRITEARIRLDSAKNAAEQAKDEFNELVAMYKQEDFAEMTKELVLKRGRHSMDIAKRRLSVQQDKFTDLQKTVLPRERAALQGKVADASDADRVASLKADKVELENAISVSEAEQKLETSREELQAVRKKIAKRVSK